MTVLQLKRGMDRRFTAVEAKIAASKAELLEEIRRSEAETRRHMDMIAESLRNELRVFAKAMGIHSERLNGHYARIHRLE